MAQAPMILLPTNAYQPLPNQAEEAFAIVITNRETGEQQLMTSEGRVVRFANYYRAADVLGWVEQHYKPYMDVVAYDPKPSDILGEDWEKLNTGSYQTFSARRRLQRLGLG